MAIRRPSGAPRGRDLFRAEVSSLVADLGGLTGDEAPPGPGGGVPADRPPRTPQEPFAEAGPDAPAVPLAPTTSAAPPEVSAADGAPPAPPTPPSPPTPTVPPELEDPPSFSPSYLPPLPPALPSTAWTAPGTGLGPLSPPRPAPAPGPPPSPPGGWLAAALAAGAAERAAPPAPRHAVPPPEAWPEPPEPLPPPAPAGALVEPDPYWLTPATTTTETAPPPFEPREAGGASLAGFRAPVPVAGADGPAPPGWQAASAPVAVVQPDLSGMPGWELPPSPDASGRPQPEPPLPEPPESGQRFRSSPPSGAAAIAERLGTTTEALSAPPGVTPSGPLPNQRLGLPLLPGGAAAPVSTRPWSLTAATQPLPPLGPSPGRLGSFPATEPPGPAPARPRAGRTGLPFAAVVALLIGVLLVLVVLIALQLRP